MKKRPTAWLLALAIAGCQTVSPVPQAIQNSRMTLEFDEASLAECIISLVVDVNTGWQPPNGSIGLLQEPDLEKEAEKSKFERFREFCGERKITLHVDNCAPLDLLTFLTKCAGVGFEFRGFVLRPLKKNCVKRVMPRPQFFC